MRRRYAVLSVAALATPIAVKVCGEFFAVIDEMAMPVPRPGTLRHEVHAAGLSSARQRRIARRYGVDTRRIVWLPPRERRDVMREVRRNHRAGRDTLIEKVFS